MDVDENDPVTLVRSLEAELGLTSGFFDALFKEDDWSFVIKLHALFEAALSHLLEHRLGEPTLRPVVARLEMSNPDTGKLAFARALGVLDKGERRFLTQLSQVRNKLVHDVRNVQFSFESYVNAMDENQSQAFIHAFEDFFPPIGKIQDFEVKRESFVRDNPKLAFWLASLMLLAMMYQYKELARVRAELNATLRKTLDARAG